MKNQTRQSMGIYVKNNLRARFHLDSRSLFEERRPNKNNNEKFNNNNNNNNTSSYRTSRDT